MNIIPGVQKQVFEDTSLLLEKRKKVIDILYELRSDRFAPESQRNWEANFAPVLTCEEGSKTAVSDYSHDFGKPDKIVLRRLMDTLPKCGADVESYTEAKLLESLLNSRNQFNGRISEANGELEMLVGNGTKFNRDNTKPSNFKEDEGFYKIEGKQYTAVDLGTMGWDKSMSSLNRNIAKARNKFVKKSGLGKKLDTPRSVDPILQRAIQKFTRAERVYIIDDIHSTAFVEQIKTKRGEGDPSFWCYLQTAQTIFDPAGKMSPATKPDVFKNVDYGWYDMRTDSSQNINAEYKKVFKYPLTPDEFDSETTITDSKQKLVVRNDVWLTMTGNTSDPSSYKVNFFTKIADGSYAVFDNTSAAIKNRTYMSTKIMDILSKLSTTDGVEGQKAHMIAKRFGDQSQAEVTCDHAIPYLYKDVDEIKSGTSNGKHIFVTKDRIAVVAALSYGAPMVLHIKSGNPKDKLHNILYINNELIEIPDTAKTELITKVEAYNDDQSTNEVIFDASAIIESIEGRFDEFSALLREPKADFIEYVENISAATITCMALDRFKQDIEDTKTIIDRKIVIPDGRVTDKDYNRMRKQLTDFRLKKGTLGKLIAVADDFILNNEFSALRPTLPTGRRSRSRSRNSVPTIIKELRFAWNKTNTHISTLYSKELTQQFAIGCINRCPKILQDNKGDVDNIYNLLTGQTMEMVQTPNLGFAPKRDRDGGSVTMTEEIQPIPATRKFFGSGVVGGESLPIDLLRPYRVANMSSYDWTIGLPKNELGQIESTPLIDTRFAIAALAIIYDSPQLIYLKYHQAKVFVDEYRRVKQTTPDQGFAPNYQVEQPDSEEAINDLHTEISYLHRYVTDDSPRLELKARVLDILWNIRGNKTKELFEPNRPGYLWSSTPTEDNVYHAEIETDEEIDPIVQVNEYARSILGTIKPDDDTIDPDEGTIPNSDSSLRIMITSSGFLDERCGFFINCVKPILYIEDSYIKRYQTTKAANIIKGTGVVKPSFLGL